MKLTTLRPRIPLLTIGRTHVRPLTTQSIRITGRALQAIRVEVLTANPWCVHCQAKGIERIATDVDHIVALENGGIDSPNPHENRQGLCRECHDIKSKADNARRFPTFWI